MPWTGTMNDPVARLVQGVPTMIDFWPTVAVAAGSVMVIGNRLGITHHDCSPSTTKPSAYAADTGDCVYEVTGDAVIAINSEVYWDAATNKCTLTVGTNKKFGTAVTACAAANGKFYARHVG